MLPAWWATGITMSAVKSGNRSLFQGGCQHIVGSHMITSYVSGLREVPQPSQAHTANRFRAQCSAKLLWPHPEAKNNNKS